jgi:cytoskeletal protein CcmA (bactofilin family)
MMTGHSAKAIDTFIGAGIRIDGNIACNGVMRVQGDVVGNVACEAAPNGTLVVDGAGSVTGAVHATHVSIMGRVVGPVQCSQSIEVHPTGTLVGDVSFKEMAIHAGGIVEGLLRPEASTDAAASVRERPISQAPTAAGILPTDDKGGLQRLGGVRGIGVVVVLAVIGMAAWLGRDLLGRPANDVALQADSPSNGSSDIKRPATGNGELRQDVKLAEVAASTAPAAPSPVPSPVAVQPGAAPEVASPDRPQSEEAVVTVKGANPRRPANVFLLISNESSVLYRKKRDDPGDGTRIVVAEGERASVSIGPDELIRVARGGDVVILFQGQKVSQRAIESGSWISFIPR